MVQPENEYSLCYGWTSLDDIDAYLHKGYMQYVIDQYREGGITVPLLSNDALPFGHFAPGTEIGSNVPAPDPDHPLIPTTLL